MEPTVPHHRAGQSIDTVENKVEGELTRLLYRLAWLGLSSNFVVAAVLAAGVWAHFPAGRVVPWLAAMLVLTAVRWQVNRVFFSRIRGLGELRRWRRVRRCPAGWRPAPIRIPSPMCSWIRMVCQWIDRESSSAR